MNIIFSALGQTLHTVITLYIWIIIIASLMSFVRPDPSQPLVQALYRLTEPVLGYVRAKLPFVVFSGVDLSPLLVILALQLFDNVIINTLF